jgi:hypothetical protein
MPNWKKVIVSGSAGSLSSLNVDTFITASIISANEFTGSLYGTASQAVSSSYAATASFAFSIPDQGFQFTQAIGTSSWTVNHNLNTFTPLVDVYDSSYNQLIPAGVSSISSNTTQITFSTEQAGYAIISKGSGVSSTNAITASYALTASFVTTAQTASYILNAVSASRATSAANADTASFVTTAQTASYVLNAVSSSFATTASYLNPITNSYVVLTQVSASLNFVDDTAAAAGGVPLGGLYRNGNFILIRIS